MFQSVVRVKLKSFDEIHKFINELIAESFFVGTLIHNKTVDEFGAEVWDLICIGEYIPLIDQTQKTLEDLKEMLSLV